MEVLVETIGAIRQNNKDLGKRKVFSPGVFVFFDDQTFPLNM
jgi:hypothetical protein